MWWYSSHATWRPRPTTQPQHRRLHGQRSLSNGRDIGKLVRLLRFVNRCWWPGQLTMNMQTAGCPRDRLPSSLCNKYFTGSRCQAATWFLLCRAVHYFSYFMELYWRLWQMMMSNVKIKIYVVSKKTWVYHIWDACTQFKKKGSFSSTYVVVVRSTTKKYLCS